MARPFGEILPSLFGRPDRVCDVGVERRGGRGSRAVGGGPANFVFDLLSKNMSCFAAAAEQRVNEGRKTPPPPWKRLSCLQHAAADAAVLLLSRDAWKMAGLANSRNSGYLKHFPSHLTTRSARGP